jgi:hypothetical protein
LRAKFSQPNALGKQLLKNFLFPLALRIFCAKFLPILKVYPMKLIYHLSVAITFLCFGFKLSASDAIPPNPTTATTAVLDTKVDRDQDSAKVTSTFQSTDAQGNSSTTTNRFTLLENCLHYLDDAGHWQLSEDVIESFPQGAVARRGPNKAIFSSDLAAASVFDIQTPKGLRLHGGIRSLHLTDMASGESVVLGTVRPGVTGELLPPNRIVWKDAFAGSVRADVIMTWSHNFGCQDVVLRTKPVLPDGFSPDTTRFEIATEFLDAPDPQLTEEFIPQNDQPAFLNHPLIHFDGLSIITGRAFPVEEGTGVSLGNWDPNGKGSLVQKQWQKLEDGRTFLIESIAWKELLPHLDTLALAGSDSSFGKTDVQIASKRSFPYNTSAVSEPRPIQIAAIPYEPHGYAIDWTLVSTIGNFDFATGETYILRVNCYITGAATFNPGSVIKMWGTNGASLTLSGSISFPDTLQSIVFTSIDDDGFGEKFPGNSSPFVPASDGDPSNNQAQDDLRIWYVTSSTLVQGALFKYSQNGIEYFNTGASANHTVKNCRFEQIQSSGYGTAVQVAIPTGRTVTFTGSEKYAVDGDSYISTGTVIGTLATAPLGLDKSFFAYGYNDRTPEPIFGRTAAKAPDTMGAAGPDHFVEVVNQSVVIFNKSTGATVETASASALFTGQDGTTLFDPRIYYDSGWGRWVATMLEPNAHKVRIAISSSPNPTGLSSWNRFVRDLSLTEGQTTFFADFPTLGADGNGIYIVTRLTPQSDDPFLPTKLRFAIIPIKKPGGGMISDSDIKSIVYLNEDAGYRSRSAVPALNYDAVTSSSYAWLLSKGSPGTGIQYRKMCWTGASFDTFSIDATWSTATAALPTPTFYDLDNNYDFALVQKNAMQQQVASPNELAGSRLQMAVVRNGLVWTCFHIGLDGTDGDYDGPTSQPDRLGVQWAALKITPTGYLSLDPSDGGMKGRIYDDASTSSPYMYAFPSMAVNSSGDFIIGFSCARATEFIGALYSGRKNGVYSPRPTLIQAGRYTFIGDRWGDYSGTSVDPDGTGFWTIQEYAEKLLQDIEGGYGLWIQKIK